MELYHGSNVYIEKPNLALCKPFKDFGKGFYLSAQKEQALDLAKQRVRVAQEGEPIINTFLFDESLTFQYFFGTERALEQLTRI